MPKAIRVLVVGTGSIGQRHMRNLVSLGADVRAFSHRAAPVPDGIKTCADLANGLATDCDAVVIANRTDQHVAFAMEAARAGRHLFVEKPLSNSLIGVSELATETALRGLVVEAGFMLRFHPNLRWIKSFLEQRGLGVVHYARALIGQHLAQWRPGTDHRNAYSARRDWGGGVVLDLVHEFDVLRWLLGEVEETVGLLALGSGLQIETEAVAQVGMRLRSGVLAQAHLDYVRPQFARSLEIVGSRGVLHWDYVRGEVTGTLDSRAAAVLHRVPENFERNEMFKEHMRHFLNRISVSSPAASSLEDSAAVLRIALAVHKSAEDRAVVRPEDVAADYRIPDMTGGMR